jgi:hypothetical protein
MRNYLFYGFASGFMAHMALLQIVKLFSGTSTGSDVYGAILCTIVAILYLEIGIHCAKTVRHNN